MIDWDRVNELRNEVGAEDFQEVFEMFLEEVEETMGRMVSVPNPAVLEEDMHFLKGSALNLGFKGFSNLCEIGEKAAKTGQTGTISLDEVWEVYAVSKIAFKEQFNTMKLTSST